MFMTRPSRFPQTTYHKIPNKIPWGLIFLFTYFSYLIEPNFRPVFTELWGLLIVLFSRNGVLRTIWAFTFRWLSKGDLKPFRRSGRKKPKKIVITLSDTTLVASISEWVNRIKTLEHLLRIKDLIDTSLRNKMFSVLY